MIIEISEAIMSIPTGPAQEEITCNLSNEKELGYSGMPLKDIIAQVKTRENVKKNLKMGKKEQAIGREQLEM